MGVLESLARFTDSVSDTINITFKGIDDFIDTVVTFFVGMGFWVSVLSFFLIFFLLFATPLLLMRYWDNISENYNKLMNKFISSISDK